MITAHMNESSNENLTNVLAMYMHDYMLLHVLPDNN